MSQKPERDRRTTDVRTTSLERSISGLAAEVRTMNENLVELSERIDRRPTRQETTYRRRLTVFGIVVLVLAIMQVTDLHTESCGPGHRSEAIVTALVGGKIRSIHDFNDIAKRATPQDWCGLTFPTHTHDGHSWPEHQHIAGIVMYLCIIGGLAWWTFRPYRRSRRPEDS